MASPQLEEGSIAIALDLHLALTRYDFTSLERRVIDAVLYLTYGAGKTKSEMTTEDIRYILGASNKVRTDRLEEAITKLIGLKILFRQELVNGGQILGLQKDYDAWADKMSGLSNTSITNNTNTLLRSSADKMSSPARLLEYALSKSQFKLGISHYKAELKQAKRLYLEVIARTQSGSEAYDLICDYIDENEWMRLNVRMPFTYMSSRFEAWRTQIPRKPREIRETEEALGRRYRYNVHNKQWEAVMPTKEVTA